MATTTATVTAIDLEEGADMVLDPNIAPNTGSDTAPIQPSASATAMATVTAMDSKQTVDMVLTPSSAVASQSDDDGSRFSQKASSEKFEFMGDDDVTKEEKKQKLELPSSSRKKIAFEN
jgi:hypothetical protein